jgi:subfamily B ATP-binding cassette protein MsbA
LDNVTEWQIQTALERLMVGRTVIVIAHRLSTIKNAENVLVLDHGSIIESGRHEELLARDGAYKKIYARQFRDDGGMVV